METPDTRPSQRLVFAVNGKLRVIDDPDPTLLLVDYLRSRETALTGTKLACGEGGCGACTVTLTTWDERTDSLTSRPINSCLRPICLLDGQAVTTIEASATCATASTRCITRSARAMDPSVGFARPAS